MAISLQVIDAMRRNAILKAAVGLALAAVFFGTALASDPAPLVPKDDAAMLAAFDRAAAGLDDFLAKWRKPPAGAGSFSVKVGLVDTSTRPGYAVVRPGASPGKFVEWFWMINLREEGAGFAAEIGNDVAYLDNVAAGQTIHFTRPDIADWMYVQGEKIVGNFTTCPALAHASTEERHQVEEQLGIKCD